MHIYYIGGSPCSGKSTTAKRIAEKYGLYYYEVDKQLEKYIARAAEEGAQVCKKVKSMSPEETWMRDPGLQCQEEFEIYAEIFPYAIEELHQMTCNTDIITEGAIFCPMLMKNQNISSEDYMTVVPSPEFQISHYKQREWIKYVLEGCSDKEKAFDNWMQRDVLYAKRVSKECEENGYYSILNNGQFSFEELEEKIRNHFQIK